MTDDAMKVLIAEGSVMHRVSDGKIKIIPREEYEAEDDDGLSRIPADAVGLRLCKIVTNNLVMCEPVAFVRGRPAVNTVLRRAAISGEVGPVGETGDYWADFMDKDFDWTETIALSREAWNGLKNHWMRCKVEK
jgi:hypothetical protein